MADLMLSGSKFRTENYKSAFWYNREILELGYPKRDVLYRDIHEVKHKVKTKYELEKDTRILLYVPTFRTGDKIDCYKIEWESVLNSLTKSGMTNG